MDVSIMIKDFKFNYRVATIIKYNGRILLHKNRNDEFYAIPGGRIKVGEDSISALKREFIEEMGIDINIGKMLGVIENFFEYNNNKYHEIMYVYEGEFKENSELYKEDVITGLEKNENLDFIWKTLEEIKELDIRPVGLKEIMLNKNKDFCHIVEKTH